ncbi:MAG: stage III sporulation protein AG [Oscillospiraceae bacterium]|jgi:stage III sporulation protein AG|nr:stage III sporulation protein AG [Oscillospiraceae bacterium]
MKTEIHELRGLKELLKNSKLLAAILAGAVLLLVLPRGKSAGAERKDETDTLPQFSLSEEEKRIEDALERMEGVGEVKVLLTLESTAEREYARDVDENSTVSGSGDNRTDRTSKVTNLSGRALNVRSSYPRYRGALVVVSGGGAALRLELTNAVSALTGLSTDKISVVKGNK